VISSITTSGDRLMTQRELTLFVIWCWLQVSHKAEVSRTCKRRYHVRHRAEILQRTRCWQESHRDRRNQNNRNWMAAQQETNTQWRVRKNLATRIWWALRAKVCGSKSVLKLLGCSVEELRAHLQNQFLPGMSWDNYGEWHIDHIRPCASFDLTDLAQQRECFNFKNLQPLWAKDNLSKGAKYAPKP